MQAALSSEKQAILDQFFASPLAAAMIERMVANPALSAEQAGRDSLDRWGEMSVRKDEAMKAMMSGLSAIVYEGAKKQGVSDERRSQQAGEIAEHQAATPEHAFLRGTACPVRINCRNAA
jgi:hypothetical protein